MKEIIKNVLCLLVFVCLIICMEGLLSGCGEPQAKPDAKVVISVPKYIPLTASEIADKFKASNLPISNVLIYDENNDPNKLMGRPNQYISKVNFEDTNVEQLDSDDPIGGSVEVFKNTTDLNTRKSYIESIEKDSPMFTEYMVVNGNYLLRLNKALTPDQVEAYKKVFMELK